MRRRLSSVIALMTCVVLVTAPLGGLAIAGIHWADIECCCGTHAGDHECGCPDCPSASRDNRKDDGDDGDAGGAPTMRPCGGGADLVTPATFPDLILPAPLVPVRLARAIVRSLPPQARSGQPPGPPITPPPRASAASLS